VRREQNTTAKFNFEKFFTPFFRDFFKKVFGIGDAWRELPL
jgi:hypothetical protein